MDECDDPACECCNPTARYCCDIDEASGRCTLCFSQWEPMPHAEALERIPERFRGSFVGPAWRQLTLNPIRPN